MLFAARLKGPRIAFIGAGSVVSTRTLISDILSYPTLRKLELRLMDIDAERLKIITELAKTMTSKHASNASQQHAQPEGSARRC